MSRHLVVFAKTPRPGTVKTRLCPPLSYDAAADIARAFLLDVLDRYRDLPGYQLTLAYAPRGTRREMVRLAGRGWHLRLQQGADLGERIGCMFSKLLKGGEDRAIIIGTDSPQLASERLTEATEALNDADMVLGPCEDGGFYLIGLRRWQAGLLDHVRWSTCHALEDTLSRAQRLRFRVTLLETDYDVDDFEGLRRLAWELERLPAQSLQHTRAALRYLGLAELLREKGTRESSV